MGFQSIITAFHKDNPDLIGQAMEDIEIMIENHPEEIDDLVQFAISNLKEDSFLFMYSMIEQILTSFSFRFENGYQIRSSFFFILLKNNNVQNTDPNKVNNFDPTSIFTKYKLLTKLSEGRLHPQFNNANKLSNLPIGDFYLFFKDALQSFPKKPRTILHKETKLNSKDWICVPLFIHEDEMVEKDFMEKYMTMNDKKRDSLHKELSQKFNLGSLQYEVLEILPALEIKGVNIDFDDNDDIFMP